LSGTDCMGYLQSWVLNLKVKLWLRSEKSKGIHVLCSKR